MRCLILILGLFVWAQMSSAQERFAQEPPPQVPSDVPPVCGGKYKRAGALLSKTFDFYGTLYAGGYSYRGNQGVEWLQYTLNSYRLLTGLEPFKHQGFWTDEIYAPFPYDTEVRLRKALKFMWTQKDFPHSPFDTAIIINASTFSDISLRQYGDYDLDMSAERKEIYERVIQESSELRWLQAALEISLERHPWRTGTNYPNSYLEAAMETIEREALDIAQINQWYALLSEHRYYGRPIPLRLQSFIDESIARVEACSASEREYTILLAGDLGLPERFVPANIRQQRLVKDARFLTATHGADIGLDGSFHAQIKNLSERAVDPSEFALPLMLSAPDIDALAAAYELKSSSHRHLSALPTRHIERLSPRAAFARYLSLGDNDNAQRMFSQLGSEDIDMPQDLNLPLRVRQTIAGLRMDCLALYLDGHRGRRLYRRDYHCHRNLPSYYATGEFVKTEASEWLYPTFEPWKNTKSYYRQYGGDFMTDIRHDRRHRKKYHEYRNEDRDYHVHYGPKYHPMEIGRLPDVLGTSNFALLMDRGELSRLTGDENLIRIMTLNITEWVESASSSERRVHADLMAEALHRAVFISEHEPSGTIDGLPSGQKAFVLLHRYFPGSDWAQKTPHWFKTREEHG